VIRADNRWIRPLLVASLLLNLTAVALGIHFIVKRGGLKYLLAITEPSRTEPAIRTGAYRERVELLKGLPIPAEAVIMLGDSLTQWGEWGEWFPGCRVVNRGINGDTVPGAEARVADYLATRPRKLFIMLGTNDLSLGDSIGTIEENYVRLLKKIRDTSPSTLIYVQALFPRAEISLSTIVSLNERLTSMAGETGATFVDTFTPFRTDGGHSGAAFFIQDGVHLSPEGYRLWRIILDPIVRN
jgi:GDSL-like lipase/acylhydrolase family protein